MDFQPAYNRCKLTIQILLFSNSIPYKNFSCALSILRSIQSTNYILVTRSTYISFMLCHFNWIFKQIFFLCICSRQYPIVTTAHTKNFQTSNMSVLELPLKLSYKEEMFKDYLEDLVPTKSQEGILIMLNYLL